MQNSLSTLLLTVIGIWLLISCVFMVLVIAACFFAFRWFQHFVSPDLNDMSRRLQALKSANPYDSTEALVRKIIRQQALRAAVVGAITGLGGFITLPVALPLDLLASLRIQATMVQFIAMLYGEGRPDSEQLKFQTYLVMSGGAEVTETSFNLVMRIAVRIIGESFSVFIPVLGAVVGFAVNYTIAQLTGTIAMRWYANQVTLTSPQSHMTNQVLP